MASDSPPERPTLSLGQLFVTPNALGQLTPEDVKAALARHIACDWGDVCSEDRKANDQALVDNTRILSVYHSWQGNKFWIITEADRSITTVLMPEDY